MAIPCLPFRLVVHSVSPGVVGSVISHITRDAARVSLLEHHHADGCIRPRPHPIPNSPHESLLIQTDIHLGNLDRLLGPRERRRWRLPHGFHGNAPVRHGRRDERDSACAGPPGTGNRRHHNLQLCVLGYLRPGRRVCTRSPGDAHRLSNDVCCVGYNRLYRIRHLGLQNAKERASRLRARLF